MDSAADRTPTRLAVDYGNKRAEAELASGLVLASPLSGRAAEHEGEVGRTDYDPESRELTITFEWGETAILEIGPVERPGAPVVYSIRTTGSCSLVSNGRPRRFRHPTATATLV